MSQTLKTEELIKKALLYYCKGNEECLTKTKFNSGNFKGEIILTQTIDTIDFIKVYPINSNHTSYTVIPISHSGFIIEDIKIDKFNNLVFVDSLSVLDKTLLYFIMNDIHVGNIFNFKLDNESTKVKGRVFEEIKELKENFLIKGGVIPNFEKNYLPKNCNIQIKQRKNKHTILLYLITDYKTKIIRKKVVFKNGFLRKVKSKTY